MRKEVLRTYDTAARVLACCHERPDPNPIGATAVTTLETLTGRMGGLLEQFEAGVHGADASTKGKARVRRQVRGQIEDLQRFTDTASLRQPELALRFKVPSRTLNQKSFVAVSRNILALVSANRDVLLTYGMPESLPETISKGLDRYQSVEVQKVVSQQRHVGASAEIEAVRQQMIIAIRHLDALQRVRFADNAELLAAWLSARDVHGPGRPPLPEPKGPAPDIRPAA